MVTKTPLKPARQGVPVLSRGTGKKKDVRSEGNGHICTDNTTTTPIGSDEVFTGSWQDTLNYNVIIIGISTDQDSATDGLEVQWSIDGVNVTQSDSFSIIADTGKVFTFSPPNQYVRLVYTNGSTEQTSFSLQTIFKKGGFKASSHRINDSIVGQDDAELVKAVLSGENPNGIFKNVKVSEDGNLTISDNSDGLAIAEGKVTGKSRINKFGYAPSINILDGFATVWDGAEFGAAWELMNPVYSTSADIDSISSSDNSDTQLIEVVGLDGNYNLVTQSKALNGQTRVALDISLIRVFRKKNIGSTDLLGHAVSYVNTVLTAGIPTDKTKIRSIIHQGANQTEMSVFTIPAGKKGYMRSWYASTAGVRKVSKHTVKIIARPFGEVFQLKQRRNFTSEIGLDPHPYDTPPDYEAKTDIEIRVNTDIDDVGISSGFNIVLVDE